MARVLLCDIGWTEKHTSAFERCKQAIIHRNTLAHRDESKTLNIYHDASVSHWSGILIQVTKDQLRVLHAGQGHEPLVFYSGSFAVAQAGRSTLEKEAVVCMATIERSHWIVSCTEGFYLSTDYKTLIFIFEPLSIITDLGQAAMRKVLQWAVRISAYNYFCFHIRGEDNL